VEVAREDTGERNERVDDVEKRKKGGVGWVVGVSEVLVVTLGREWFPSIFPRYPKAIPSFPYYLLFIPCPFVSFFLILSTIHPAPCPTHPISPTAPPTPVPLHPPPSLPRITR
jgi:hypothetical protein